MKMVLASKNPHKLTEMAAILGRLGVEVSLWGFLLASTIFIAVTCPYFNTAFCMA